MLYAFRVLLISADFELVRNAVFTEPADQSSWLYLRWLISQTYELCEKNLITVADRSERLTKEIESVSELKELEPDSKWVLLTYVYLVSMAKEASLHAQSVSETLQRLSDVDPFRRNYYKSLKPQIHEEKK